MTKEKIKWTSLLFIAILLFLGSIVTGNTLLNIFSISIAILVYVKGNDVLFSEYNQRLKDKKDKQELMKKATQQIIKEGRLKKSRGGE